MRRRENCHMVLPETWILSIFIRKRWSKWMRTHSRSSTIVFVKTRSTCFISGGYRESSDYFMTKKHRIQQLEGADAATFVSLGYGYAKDSS